MPLDEVILIHMLTAVANGQATRLEYDAVDFRLTVTRADPQDATPPSPPETPAQPAAQSAAGVGVEPRDDAIAAIDPSRGALIRSPFAGTFYRAQAPGQAPFADDGDRVNALQTLGLVEVMKLYTSIKAGRDARVRRFLVADASLVTAGEPLVVVDWD